MGFKNAAVGAGTGAADGASEGTKVLPGWGTAIGATIGAGAGAYGAYLQSQQSDRDYQQSLLAWQEEMKRQKELDAQNAAAQAMQGRLAVGNYAEGQIRNAGGDYAAYARSLGL